MRDHLIDKHWNLYSSIVLANELKGWEKIASGVISGPEGQKAAIGDREPFSVEGFYERLIKWVVVDDQVCWLSSALLDTH